MPKDSIVTKPDTKILVVDDSATIRASFTRDLPQDSSVVEAKDGEEAWQTLNNDNQIELVITDLDMPKMDGYKLIERIRSSSNSRISNIPIIVITGDEFSKAKYSAFKAGANDFITKNIDKYELMARVKAHQKLAKTIRELENSRRNLKMQADTDALTKLTNRRSFFARSRECLALMNRHQEHFSALMIDIDHFKAINDTYGHQAGDFVLVEVSKILSRNIRANDILARIGGEEFAIALPYSNRLASVVLAERLREAVCNERFEFGGNVIPVTISLGISANNRDKPGDIDQMLAIADQRLYIAKRKGRNRLCASDDADEITNRRAYTHDLKLDDAVTLVGHGNEQEVIKHLAKLIEKSIPLFELGNQLNSVCFDIDGLKRGIEKLKEQQSATTNKDA